MFVLVRFKNFLLFVIKTNASKMQKPKTKFNHLAQWAVVAVNLFTVLKENISASTKVTHRNRLIC